MTLIRWFYSDSVKDTIHHTSEIVRFLVLGVAAFTFMVCSSSLAAVDGGSSEWPGGRWTPDEPQYAMIVEKKVPIVMDDGATLYADIGYPADRLTRRRAKGTFPVLLTQNQYCIPLTNRSAFKPFEEFVSRGYIYVVAQVRGTGYTSGPDGEPVANDMFGERQAKDGARLVDWVAHELDGSNGVVGLHGMSFLGMSQLFTAAELGPDSPVKAIIPAASGNSYSFYFPGGIMSATQLLADRSATALISGLKNFDANVSHSKWIGTQYYEAREEAYNGDYWQTRYTSRTVEQIVKNGIPALMWTGWNAGEIKDGLALYGHFQNAAAGLPTFGPMTEGQALTGRYQIVVGPWGHGQGMDQTVMLEWYDHWLKGQDTGIDETETPMHLYEMQGDRWVNAAHIPIATTYTTFHIDAEGGLTYDTPELGQDTLRRAPPEEEESTLTFTSLPFTDAKTIAGPMTATIWASSSNTNMELVVILYDVDQDGNQTEISHGALLGSLRALDETGTWTDANGTIMQATQAYTSDDYLTPGKTERFDIGLLPNVWLVDSGHALRLVICTQSPEDKCSARGVLGTPWPCMLTSPQEDTLPGGVYTILRGGATATGINLPLIDPESLPTTRSSTTETSDGETIPLEW